jgi:DNA-directed RNA polymerase specialized sigma24 family protein
VPFSRARHNSAAKRGARITGSLDEAPGASPAPLPCPSISDQLTDDELASLTELLRRALASVDKDTRELLRDNVMLEMTCQELSAKYQMPSGTVSSKLSRGLKKIRASLLRSPKLWQQLHDFLRY